MTLAWPGGPAPLRFRSGAIMRKHERKKFQTFSNDDDEQPLRWPLKLEQSIHA